MKPFKITVRNNIDSAQAFGCWLYVQCGRFAIMAGRFMPCGFRITWNRGQLRMGPVRFRM
jgi:hypothetical protein